MKKTAGLLAVTAFIMLALPWLTVTLVRSDAAMAVCFLLFFAVDPLIAALVGAAAGKDLRARWFLPLIPAALFLVGAWVVFDPGEPAFVRYAAVYLAIGLVSMLVAAWIRKRKGKA